MKKRLKHLSKPMISLLLALMMVVSTVMVGFITTTAAFVEPDDSVGAKVDSETVGYGGSGVIGIWYGTSDDDGMSTWAELEREGTSTKYSHVFSLSSTDYFISLTNGTTQNWHWNYVWSSDPSYDNQYTSVVTDVKVATRTSNNQNVHRLQITVRPPSGSSTVNVKFTWDTSNSKFTIASDKDPVCASVNLTASKSTLSTQNETFTLTATPTTPKSGTITYKFYREGTSSPIATGSSSNGSAVTTGALQQSDVKTAKYYVVAHNDNYMDVQSSKVTITNNAIVESMYYLHGSVGGEGDSGWSKDRTFTYESGNVFYIDLQISATTTNDQDKRFRLYKINGSANDNDYGPVSGNVEVVANASSTTSTKKNVDTNYFYVRPATTGKYRLYVDQTNDPPVIWISTQKKVASSVALTITPDKVKLGNKVRSMTATVTGVDSSLTSRHNITYTFKKADGTVIQTVTKKANETTCTINDIPTGTGTNFTTMTTYPITVEVSTTETYTDGSETKSYLPVSGTANLEVNNGNVYYTSNGAVDSPTWTALTNNALNTITSNVSSLSAGNSFTFALSSEADYVDAFPSFNISQEDNRYCRVTQGTKRIDKKVNGEDVGFTVFTYTVTPLTGIKANSAKLYIDIRIVDGKPVNKIYAKAEFVKTTESTNTGYSGSSGKKVRYYFAKKADQDNDSVIDGRKNDLYVKFWNNSVEFDNSWGNSSIPEKLGGYAQAKPVGKDGKLYDTVSSSTKIYVDTNALRYDTKPFDDSGTVGNSNFNDSTNSKNITFNVYAVDLPIWATSACLRTNSDSDLGSTDLITLNPNRIYLFYKWDNEIRRSGVPLDEKFWDAFTADSRKNDTYKNEADEKTFKVNAVKYNKTASGSSNTWYKVNDALSNKYKNETTASDNPGLYFGMFAGHDSLNMTNWHYMANIAMRWNDVQTNGHNSADDYKLTGGCPYYASIWDLVGMHLKPVTTTTGGVTKTDYKLQNFKEDQIEPFFDYSWLKTTPDAAEYVYENLDFPFVASKYDGVTTYSYDSQVDSNRTIKNVAGSGQPASYNYANAHSWVKVGSMLGYSPFEDLTVTGTKSKSFANEFKIEFYLTNTGSLKTDSGNPQDIQFNFSGDDDVWVFVDGVLVLDLGGDHMPSAGSINFTDKKVYYKTAADSIKNHSGETTFCGDSNKNDNTTGRANVKTLDLAMILNAGSLTGEDFNFTDGAKKHTLQMFYMERGENESNCSLSFNLPQASGLNVYSEVTANNVNPGLKAAAMLSANTDAFRYNVSVKKANDTEWNNVSNTYSLISSRQTPAAVSTLDALPKYPSVFDALRTFTQSFTYGTIPTTTTMKGKLSSSSSSNPANSTVFNTIPTSYTTLSGQTYELNDNYVETASYDPIAGKTKSESAGGYAPGDFNLLTGQKATFDNKVPANMMVKLYQNKDLDGADYTVDDNTGKENFINTHTVAMNEVYDYYTTTYDIYDNQLQYYVKDKTDATSTANIYADDNSANTDSFYFTNYTSDSSVTNPAMTVSYYNDINVGNIKIQKVVGTDENATSEVEFSFKVYFKDIFGFDEEAQDYSSYREYKEYPIVYHRYTTDGNTPVFGSTDDPDPAIPYDPVKGIRLRAGEYAIIEGVPVETEYKVVEGTTTGYTLSMIKKWAKYPGYENTSGSGDILYKSRNADDSAFINKEIYYERIIFDSNEFLVTPEGPQTWENAYAANSTFDFTHEIPNGNRDNSGNPLTDEYPVNSIPIRSQTNVTNPGAEDEYISTSWVQFTNQREGIQISFNYYPRLVVNGQPATISSSPDTYTFTIEDLYEKDDSGDFKYITMSGEDITAVDFSKMIKAAMYNFMTYNGGVFRNVIDDYQFFTSQTQAQDAFAVSGKGGTLRNPANSMTAINYGEYTAENIKYHTNYISQPITTSNRSDMWVSYFNDRKNLTNDNYVDVEGIFGTAADVTEKEEVKKINLWLYNYPRLYKVRFAEADTSDTAVNFNHTGTFNNYYVGNNLNDSTYYFYYNQRFGGKAINPDGTDPNEQLYFLGPNEYGYESYTGQDVITAQSVTLTDSDDTELKFLYWSFDPYGYSKASDDIRYYYRVSTDFTLYPVYGTEVQYDTFKENPSLSVSLNGDDSFFDVSGNARRRINVLMSPCNCPDYDSNIYSTAVIYVTLGEDVKTACTVGGNLDEKKVNEFYQLYKNQLPNMIQGNKVGGNLSPFVYQSVNYTLTTKGFKYDVNPDYGTYNQIELTNKNRVQFSTRFTVSPAKGEATGLTDCFGIAAAMLYHDEDSNSNNWIVSDNTVVYDFGKPLSVNP
ncbi:MAG: hypothetical protein UIH27_16110 [Ruminococcus sp.]|nr:hypothetical protein [Ruminococcus sp.]